MNDSSSLSFTGERFVPGVKGEIWIEHWHRYHFASAHAHGRRVLDVACGEGYGSALLARRAARVTGIDVSPEAIAHASREYADVPNVEFVRASCTRLPLADGSVDLAVSFETLEHIAEQERFLDEIARVLAPGGIAILSCPNKLEYTDRRGYTNEFHMRELYRDELASLVESRFPHVHWYGQMPSFYSVIAPTEISLSLGRGSGAGSIHGELLNTHEANPAIASNRLADPLYFILVAARDAGALHHTATAISVLADRDQWVRRDYEKVMRMMEEAHRHAEALAATVGERDAALRGREVELLAARLALSKRDYEAERRKSWTWWFKLPLIRLGLLK